MALPNPTALTGATRFKPAHFRTHSRSPSRSPVRKAKFTAQHLDPLLSNLTPESTLQALQATETIPAGSTEGVLAKSIADASPEEREIGIRAAFAAQKLKQWRAEISRWLWPNRRDCALGAGFLPPPSSTVQEEEDAEHIYIGYLPLRLLNEYEDQIEHIKDGLESLEMEDLKDHVLTAHSSSKPPPSALTSKQGARTSYGRMRDFTALITATVIQALPDLATINMLIDTWDVRIAVLRELPMFLDLMDVARGDLTQTAQSCRQPEAARIFSLGDFHRVRQSLDEQVRDLGRKVDKMLDLLDGHDDSLPQGWIDQIEKLELDFATWTAEAEQLANSNASSGSEAKVDLHGMTTPPLSGEPPASKQEANNRGYRPTLDLDIPMSSSHRRDKSEVSIADSVLSAVSAGEIVDARKSQVLLSPTVTVVESPISKATPRPAILQRASTASIEVVSRGQLKTLDVRRSMSADLLTRLANGDGDVTPTGPDRRFSIGTPSQHTPMAELDDPSSRLELPPPTATSSALPTPSLMVEPLRVPSRENTGPRVDAPNSRVEAPSLPRRSSKRNSLPLAALVTQDSSFGTDLVSPISPDYDTQDLGAVSPITPGRDRSVHDSLDSKIQDILENLPTRIRLANKDGSLPGRAYASANSSRASTPTPALIPEMPRHSRRVSAAEAGVRVYHLHQNGQARDAKPIKLFVRAVGENGERVMVRVGGGWADLAEYLKEYSAHHGRRSTSDGLMEVAQYPGKNERERKASSQILSPTPGRSTIAIQKRTRRRSASGSSSGSRSRSPSPPPSADPHATPPVPPIPAGYTMHTPTMSVSTNRNGETDVDFEDPNPSTALQAKHHRELTPEPGPYKRTSTMHVPGVTTTTTVQSPAAANPSKYVPLGGAGPKGNARRAATYGAVPRDEQEAWVEGMVGKARRVSSNNNEPSVRTVHGPTTTTTTTVTSSASAPASRRASSMGLTALPKAAEKSSPAGSKTTTLAATPSGDSNGVVRRKSRLGLGDVSGIKRVFLRRKSTK
jgi:hypothetical protein